jgi:ketosteroid isomerase-like protein
VLLEADGLSIRRLHDAWIEAEIRGDAEAVLSLCADDIEWVPPNGPSVFGRDAGRDLLLAPDARTVSIRVTDLVVDGAEGRATKACRFETVFEVTATRLRGVVRGSHSWTLEQGRQGWRVVSVSWQVDPDTSRDDSSPP